MKNYLLVWCALLLYGDALAAIHLRGVLTVSGHRMFALSENNAPAHWKKIGESFLGFELDGYDPVRESLTLRKGDELQILKLPVSAVRDSVQMNLARTLTEAQKLADVGHKEVERALRRYRMMEMSQARFLEKLTSEPLTKDEAVVVKDFLARRTKQVREKLLLLEAEILAAKTTQ